MSRLKGWFACVFASLLVLPSVSAINITLINKLITGAKTYYSLNQHEYFIFGLFFIDFLIISYLIFGYIFHKFGILRNYVDTHFQENAVIMLIAAVISLGFLFFSNINKFAKEIRTIFEAYGEVSVILGSFILGVIIFLLMFFKIKSEGDHNWKNPLLSSSFFIITLGAIYPSYYPIIAGNFVFTTAVLSILIMLGVDYGHKLPVHAFRRVVKNMVRRPDPTRMFKAVNKGRYVLLSWYPHPPYERVVYYRIERKPWMTYGVGFSQMWRKVKMPHLASWHLVDQVRKPFTPNAPYIDKKLGVYRKILDDNKLDPNISYQYRIIAVDSKSAKSLWVVTLAKYYSSKNLDVKKALNRTIKKKSLSKDINKVTDAFND